MALGEDTAPWQTPARFRRSPYDDIVDPLFDPLGIPGRQQTPFDGFWGNANATKGALLTAFIAARLDLLQKAQTKVGKLLAVEMTTRRRTQAPFAG